MIGLYVVFYILFKYPFITLFTILDLQKSRIFLFFIGISAIVCRMFIYNATYTNKKFRPIDVYPLLGIAFMSILTAYIIIYHVQPYRQELAIFCVALLSDEILQGVETGVLMARRISIKDLLNPAPGNQTQNPAPGNQTQNPAHQNPVPQNQVRVTQNPVPPVTGQPVSVPDPRSPQEGGGTAFRAHGENNGPYAKAIVQAIKAHCWNGGPCRKGVLDNLDDTSRQYYFDWLHSSEPHKWLRDGTPNPQYSHKNFIRQVTFDKLKAFGKS